MFSVKRECDPPVVLHVEGVGVEWNVELGIAADHQDRGHRRIEVVGAQREDAARALGDPDEQVGLVNPVHPGAELMAEP